MKETNPIETIPLFRDLTAKEREDLSSIATVRAITKGETLFHSGDARKKFFVVLEGQAQIFRTFNDEVQILAILDANEFAVESALVDPSEKHEHEGEVLTDGKILEIDGKAFLNFAAKNAAVANRIYGRVITNLSERLHHANNKLVTIYSTGKIASTYDNLDHLTDLLLTTILKIVRAKRALFVLFKPLEGKAVIRDAKGYHDEQAMRNLDIHLASDPILGVVYTSALDLNISEEQYNEEKDLHTPYASKSMLITPLHTRDRVIGAILLGEKEGATAFSHNNQILLNIIGRQIVLSILTADLGEQKR